MSSTHLIDERQRGRRSAMQEAHVNHSALLHPADEYEYNERTNSALARKKHMRVRMRMRVRGGN